MNSKDLYICPKANKCSMNDCVHMRAHLLREMVPGEYCDTWAGDCVPCKLAITSRTEWDK